MRTRSALVFAGLIAACGNSPSEAPVSDQSDLTQGPRERITRTETSMGCSGWGCVSAARPVDDAELYALALKYENQNDGIARMSALECVQVPNACEYSCTVKTPCGGGGPIMSDEEKFMVHSWLQMRASARESVGWAERRYVTDVVCTRSGTATHCDFVAGGNGGGSSSGGTDPNEPGTGPGPGPGGS